MTDFTSVSLPPPKDWQAFERLTRLLFEYLLNDPTTQNNGRNGQPQHGVDVFGKRGGENGPQVGVQCKGKDVEYGGVVTRAELAREVEKTKGFKPELREFFLVTTAPDDAGIQEAARLLEQQIRAGGRNLSITVWGWGHLQQQIVRFPEVLRAFHPDGTPYTGEILNEAKEIKSLVQQGSTEQQAQSAHMVEMLQTLIARTQITGDTQPGGSTLDKYFNDQIDEFRDLIRDDKPKTALDLLTKFKDRVWAEASPHIRFRILANIGSANHRLGEFDTAADFLLQAVEFEPETPTSLANQIAALLIRGRGDEAHLLAVRAVAQHPGNSDLALQRLQARAAGEAVEAVWATLPEQVRKHPDVIIHRAMGLREGGSREWKSIIREGAALHPKDFRFKAIEAEGVLESILGRDPGAIGLAGEHLPSVVELQEAAVTMEQTWKKSLAGETGTQTAFAHNAALLRNILGEPDWALALLDQADKAENSFEESKRLRASILRGKRKVDEAIRVADTLSDIPQNTILKADLRIESNPTETRALLANRATYTDRREATAAALAVLESWLTERNFTEAEREAEQLAARLPDDPQSRLALYRVKRARGDADAGLMLDQAVRLVTPATDFPTRFLVCEALQGADRYDEIVDLLIGVTATSYDSPALRLLIGAAVNADRRAALKRLLEELSSELREKPYYRRAAIGRAIRTGNVKGAEQQIRSYLRVRPRDLEMHLQLMHGLFRQNKLEALKTEVMRPASDFESSPEDFMKFAQFKDAFGDWREAHDLAYRTLLLNHNMPAVNMGYVGVFLSPGHSKELEVSPTAVAENMAVRIELEDGKTSTYVLEPEPALRPTLDFLAPDHAISKSLLGKSLGDVIALPDHTEGKIAAIKPKVLHALHTILENFRNFFPDIEGLERIRVDTAKPGALDPMLERVKERHDAVEHVTRIYDGGTLPIALVARSFGADPVDVLIGLVETGHDIRVCEGSQRERDAALAAIDANGAQGCVVDAVTLHIIRRLKVETAVVAVCGPIGITDRTALRIQQKIHEVKERIDEKDMTLFWRDGQYFRAEVSPEQKRDALRALEEDRAWLDEKASVLPAEGKEDLAPEWRELTQRFGQSFLDEVRAAQSSGRVLLMEDNILRKLGQANFGVAGTWLQPVLMRATANGTLSRQEYVRALVGLIDSREQFISIDGFFLVDTLEGHGGHTLPREFIKLASRLGGPNADLPSHLEAAFRGIAGTWNDERLTFTVRQAFVGTLLENLTGGRLLEYVNVILRAFHEFGRDRLRSASFLQYLFDWRRGHFLL